jgi:hypothetical protein
LFDSCYLLLVRTGYSQHLFWRVLSLWLSECVRDQVSYLYKPTGKIIVPMFSSVPTWLLVEWKNILTAGIP